MRELVRLGSYLLGLSRGIRLSRLSFGAAVAAGMVSGLSLAALVAVVNAIIGGSGSATGALAWAFVALVVLRPALRFASQLLLIRLTEHAFFALRVDLCRKILATPMRHLEELGRHRLMAGIAGDVGQIAPAIVLMPTLLMHLAVIVGFLAYLGWLYWPLLPLLLVCGAFGALTSRWAMGRAMALTAAGREWYDALFKHFQAVTDGAKELKMNRRRRSAFVAGLETVARAHRREMRRADVVLAGVGSWTEMLFFLGVGGFLLLGPRLPGLGPEQLIGYVVTVLMMRTPIEGLINGLPTLTQAAVAARKVEALTASLAGQLPDEDAAEPRLPGAAWRELELVGVTHTYRGEAEDERFLLGPVDLTLRPGELVFVVGGNGSGKTTLAKVLLGIYAPEEGEIRLDGEPVGDHNRDAYRQHFSVVFSDFFLFETLLGADTPELDRKAREYLDLLRLQRKVRVSDGVLSTVDLSQGQRKRLALLGAYLEDRPIYLFDEWAADQDPQFKEIFYHHLLPELRARGKTLVVISHDDRYYGVADRVVRLEHGTLRSVEDGRTVAAGAPRGLEALARP